MAEYPKGGSPSVFVCGYIVSLISCVFLEPCHTHVKKQKLIPLLILSRLCELHVSRRAWPKVCYVNLKAGLKRVQRPSNYLRHSPLEP